MEYKVKENISWRKIGDEVLILDTRYQKKSHALNPVAAYIWESINEGADYQKVLTGILEEFEIEENQAKNDFNEFLQELAECELLILNK